jgi:hypothetical protein
MKKYFVICFLAFTLLAIKSSAQEQDSVTQLPPVTVTTTSGVNEKIDKSFKSAFPEAQNLAWYKMDEEYLAKFIHDDMSHNALYKKNGYLKYDISSGTEKNLPADIREQVQSTYSDFKIIKVFNVKEEGRNIWVVNLESMKSYVVVRVENGELEEVKKLTKAE